MSELIQSKKTYIGYEYKEVVINSKKISMCMDGYENFGWEIDEHMNQAQTGEHIRLKLKRDRKIMNKTELTRLERNFEACMEEIDTLETSIHKKACIYVCLIGILGTVFMAMSTFAVTHEPPIIWLCILFALPGFAGWISPIFLYKNIINKRTEEIIPYVEPKQEEIYELCKKGCKLLIK